MKVSQAETGEIVLRITGEDAVFLSVAEAETAAIQMLALARPHKAGQVAALFPDAAPAK